MLIYYDSKLPTILLYYYSTSPVCRSIVEYLYVGEYLPVKQLPEDMGAPSVLPPIFMSCQVDIILAPGSGKYHDVTS